MNSPISTRSRTAMLPLVLRTCAIALITEIALRTMRLDRAAKLLRVPLDTAPASPRPNPPNLITQFISDRIRATQIVFTRLSFENTCLRRALVLGRLLRRFDPNLKIGVGHGDSQEPDRVIAHAWIETTCGTFGFDSDSGPQLAVLKRPGPPRQP